MELVITSLFALAFALTLLQKSSHRTNLQSLGGFVRRLSMPSIAFTRPSQEPAKTVQA